MRNLVLATVTVAMSVSAWPVTGSADGTPFWHRRHHAHVSGACCRPRIYGYWQPRARVYGPVYGRASLGWYGPIYAPRAYAWYGRGWVFDDCGWRC
jgi:hypothetical protein